MKHAAMAFEKFGAPDVFFKTELELPDPDSSQVLVETEASSVNFADIMARKGFYQIAGPPFVAGIDFVGRVVKAGSESSEGMVGKRIVGFGDTGSYATHLLANVDLVFEIPEEMDTATAAASPLLTCTSYAILRKNSAFNQGTSLLVHAAAGGIGLTAIQMARAFGASSITALVSSHAKVEATLRAGASEVVVISDTPDYPNEIRSIHPDGVNLILNSVAGETIQQDLEILQPGGQLVVFGMSSGDPGIVKTSQLHHSSRTVAGFSFGNIRKTDPKMARNIMAEALPMAVGGQVRFDEITEFSLFEVANAHERIESRSTIGKVVLIPR